MDFNMEQFPNVLPRIKKNIKQKKLMYLKPSTLKFFKDEHGLEDFELTIFYYFEKKQEREGEEEGVRPRSKVHNVFVVGSSKPVLLLFNPCQHSFEE